MARTCVNTKPQRLLLTSPKRNLYFPRRVSTSALTMRRLYGNLTPHCVAIFVPIGQNSTSCHPMSKSIIFACHHLTHLFDCIHRRRPPSKSWRERLRGAAPRYEPRTRPRAPVRRASGSRLTRSYSRSSGGRRTGRRRGEPKACRELSALSSSQVTFHMAVFLSETRTRCCRSIPSGLAVPSGGTAGVGIFCKGAMESTHVIRIERARDNPSVLPRTGGNRRT